MSHVVRTHFIAPKDLIADVDKLVGPRRRSEFVTSAIAEKLKRENILRVVREAAKLPPVRDVPEWETPEKVSKWVHDFRVESDRKRNV